MRPSTLQSLKTVLLDSTTVKHYLKESYEYRRIEYYRAHPRCKKKRSTGTREPRQLLRPTARILAGLAPA